jgi:hypothetical protein
MLLVCFDGSAKNQRKSQICTPLLLCFNYQPHAKLLCLRDCLTFNRITSIVPQLILPLAASLSAPGRGEWVGTIMSGLLVGFCCPEP